MCNLYDIGPSRLKPRNAFEAEALRLFPTLPRQTGIRKTDFGLAVTSEDGRYSAATMRWGFERGFNNAVNNTRCDKLASAMWRESFASRRCLIPVAAFYEWTGPAGSKQAHRIASPEPDDWLWVAGLYEQHPVHGLCYSMITTAAPPWMERIHHRMIAVFDELETAAAYLHTHDPAALIVPPVEALHISPCPSPLKQAPSAGSPDSQPTLF